MPASVYAKVGDKKKDAEVHYRIIGKKKSSKLVLSNTVNRLVKLGLSEAEAIKLLKG